jgi:hypothetical protein
MADELLRIAKSDSLIFFGFMIMVFGSVVDIWQFGYLMKRAWKKRERRLYERVRKEVIVNEFDKRRVEKEIAV